MALHKFIKRYTSISATIDLLRRRELALLDPQNWDDRNDRYYMSLYKEHVQASGLYGACFTQSTETYHHWRVFTGTSDGACIEFHRAELQKHIKDTPGLQARAVDYLLLEDADKLTEDEFGDLPFVKRIGFAPEEEFRVIATSNKSQEVAFALPIELKVINKIVINPWLPEPLYLSVKAVLHDIDGCSHIDISRSHLIDSLRWKNAGNKVAGKPKIGKVLRLPRKAAKKTTPAPKTLRFQPKKKSSLKRKE